MNSSNFQIQTALDWWYPQKGINFLDWPEELFNHTYPLRIIELPPDFINKLLSNYNSDGRYHEIITQFDELITPFIKEISPSGEFFIKLISRSPKDWLADKNNFNKPRPLKSPNDALQSIMNSMRCLEDLCMLRHINKEYIIIRPFIDFHASNEWRVFVKDNQVIGISQYNFQHFFPEINRNALCIQESIMKFMNYVVIPNMKLAKIRYHPQEFLTHKEHSSIQWFRMCRDVNPDDKENFDRKLSVGVSDYIADIIIDNNGTNPILLETNPFGLSDPCLFIEYTNMDGSFLYKETQESTGRLKPYN